MKENLLLNQRNTKKVEKSMNSNAQKMILSKIQLKNSVVSSYSRMKNFRKK